MRSPIRYPISIVYPMLILETVIHTSDHIDFSNQIYWAVREFFK